MITKDTHQKDITLPADFGTVGRGGCSFPCPCCGKLIIVNLTIAKTYDSPVEK